MSIQKTKKYEAGLMQVIGFDEDDLEANAAGTLSERQVARLKGERRSQIFWLGFFAAMFGALVYLILSDPNFRNAIEVLLIGTSAIGFGAIGVSHLTKILSVNKVLEENRVLAVDGRVELSLMRKGSGINYTLEIGKLRFPIEKNAFLSFKNRDPYCVYYTPHGKRILSVEWLRDDNPFITPEQAKGEDEDAAGVPPKRRQQY